MACACEVSEFGLTRLSNSPSFFRTSSHSVVIQLKLMHQVLQREDTAGWVCEGSAWLSLPEFGEEDLVLWVDQYWALRGIALLAACPSSVALVGERDPWWFAVSFRGVSINEVPCGPCNAIRYCSMPLHCAILWLPGILPLPLVLLFARRSLEGNYSCSAVFSREHKWFRTLLCLFGPFTWHKSARVWLKISVLLWRKEPGLGGTFSFFPQHGNPLTGGGGGQSFLGWPHQG